MGAPHTYPGQSVQYFVFTTGGGVYYTEAEAAGHVWESPAMRLPWTPYWGDYIVEAPAQLNGYIAQIPVFSPENFTDGAMCSNADGCQSLATVNSNGNVYVDYLSQYDYCTFFSCTPGVNTHQEFVSSSYPQIIWETSSYDFDVE
jgi:hypothetical protein